MKPILIKRERGSGRTSVPKLSISKSNTFFVNAAGAIKLNKKDTEIKFDIYQDQENETIWYIQPNKDGMLQLKRKGAKDMSCSFSASDIAKRMRNSVNPDTTESLRFEIQDSKEYEGAVYWPLVSLSEIAKPHGSPRIC